VIEIRVSLENPICGDGSASICLHSETRVIPAREREYHPSSIDDSMLSNGVFSGRVRDACVDSELVRNDRDLKSLDFAEVTGYRLISLPQFPVSVNRLSLDALRWR
jgi:hypothetical protein